MITWGQALTACRKTQCWMYIQSFIIKDINIKKEKHTTNIRKETDEIVRKNLLVDSLLRRNIQV